MSATDKDPLVLSCVGEGKTYLADFQLANQLLEEIQKSLEEYLETKRMAFPRCLFWRGGGGEETPRSGRGCHAKLAALCPRNIYSWWHTLRKAGMVSRAVSLGSWVFETVTTAGESR